MTFMYGLRIFAVVMLGWVVALTAARVLKSVAGHERLEPRVLVGEVLAGLGAFAIGWGVLPGVSAEHETTLMIVGVLLWVFGMLIEPVKGRPVA